VLFRTVPTIRSTAEEGVAMADIDHFVVLMLENRSFDSMLGCLKVRRPEINGLTLAEFNDREGGQPVAVWNTGSTSLVIPTPDPGESWLDMNEQLFGRKNPPAGAADMSGFVRNYENQTDDPPYNGEQVMHYYSEAQLPVLTGLANQFAVCDCWHASAPCQTWPNRFFLHTGTAGGHENNDPALVPFARKTIYEQLDLKQVDWKIYYHDLPQTLTLKYLWQRLGRFRFFDEFLADAAAGTLPAYSFIEPRYFQEVKMPNDQHPPHNVALGEQLIADVYKAVRNGPNWENTLLIIIYDEHGGCYDHVPPPAAVPPDPPPASKPFAFDRYGVRVPAVLVSPWIAKGTVLRPPGATPFDHTSVLATLAKSLDLDGPPLTARVAAAPDVLSVLSLQEPTNLGPAFFEPNPFTPTPFDLAAAAAIPANGLQKSLLHMAAQLPMNATPAGITAHIQELAQGTSVTLESIAETEASTAQSLLTATAAARERLARMFQSAPTAPSTNEGGP
jgi:phospholipase C